MDENETPSSLIAAQSKLRGLSQFLAIALVGSVVGFGFQNCTIGSPASAGAASTRTAASTSTSPSSSVISAAANVPSFIDITQSPYGAVGDGKTDATAAIQSAINDASAAGGGLVIIPRGTFVISQTLNLPKGVSLDGISSAGQAADNVLADNVYPSVIKSNISSGAALITPVIRWSDRLENLTLDGAGLSTIILDLSHSPRGATVRNLLLRNTASGGVGIYLAQDPSWFPPSLNYFERVYAIDMASKALILAGATLNTFTDCSFASQGDDTVVINHGSDDNMFYGGHISADPGHTAVVLNYSGDAGGGFLNNFYGTSIEVQQGATAISASNNGGLSFFYGNYIACCGVPYSNGGGGLVKFVDVKLGTSSGYDDMFSIIPTGSPYTYTNNRPYAVDVTVGGGGVNSIEFGRNRNFAQVASSARNGSVWHLQPGDQLRVTYTVTPAMDGIPQ